MNEPYTAADFTPQLNEWYSLSGEYAGRADFRAENGIAFHGDGHVTWDDSGKCAISVDIDPSQLAITAPMIGSDVKFQDFRLTTANGVFSANKVLLGGSHIQVGETFSIQLELITSVAEFTPTVHGRAAYWACPIDNFLSEFKVRSESTDKHPLRIFPTPVVPTEIPEDQRIPIWLRANAKNRLIIFQFEGAAGFVEPLPDYEERAKLLESGNRHRAATAMMVGNVGSHPCGSADDVKSWFPTELLYALSLASGSFVGMPFAELRDSAGELVRRIHIATVSRRYESGFRPIHEFIDSGSESATGQIMSKLVAINDQLKRRFLRVAIDHLVAAGLRSQSLENAFDHLVRGFESLTKVFGLSSQDLLNGVPAASQSAVKAELQSSAIKIAAAAKNLRASGDVQSSDRLDRIAARIQSADQREAMFGLAVSDLLKKYDFADESVVNAHYRTNPRADQMSWSQVLSAYRGGVIHIGYLELTTGDSVQDVYTYIRHLHDILVRSKNCHD